MASKCKVFIVVFMVVLVLVLVLVNVGGDPIVPALCIFGDSVVDVGNNNNLQTLIKANFLPYGRDYVTHKPTGRFCNGKLATDFTAEYLGFTSYPPAFLSQEANGKNILTGVNFASAASGYYDRTAQLYVRNFIIPTATNIHTQRQVRLKHQFCAMQDRWGRAPMPPSISSGMDFTPLKPLTRNWHRAFYNKC